MDHSHYEAEKHTPELHDGRDRESDPTLPTSPDLQSRSFASLLRSYRRRANLTQQALADLSTVSARTIRNLESGRAQARTHTALLLSDGLRLNGLTRDVFMAAAGRDRGPLDEVVDTRPPAPVGALLAREAEVQSAFHVLAAGHDRMILLCGLGGVGKTSLTMEIARRLHRHRRWPVLWVSANPAARTTATDPLATGAQALLCDDARRMSRFSRLIGDHDALLVVDGIADPFPVRLDTVRELLSRCPGLRVVVTTRAPSSFTGALTAAVPPLPTPRASDHSTLSLTALASVPSVRLLVDRLSLASPGWVLNGTDAPAVTELSRRLDGLPLALHLAAQHAAILKVQELAELSPDELLSLPVSGTRPGTPVTLDSIIGASCRLSEEPGSTYLRVLADLEGTWTLDDAALALGEIRSEVVEVLTLLTRIGVVRKFSSGGTTCFEVLNLVRARLQRDAYARQASHSARTDRPFPTAPEAPL